MVTYYDRELIGELKRGEDARCLRCNAPLPATNLALRSEGLCVACAAGDTIQ